MAELNQNSNQEPEDIFAHDKTTQAASSFNNQPSGFNPNIAKTKRNIRAGRIIITVLVILVLVGVVYFLGNRFSGNIKSIFDKLTIKSSQKVPTVLAPSNNIANSTTSANQIPVDSDQDGLSDTQEQVLGTNSANSDTDGDGLFDGEEANAYHTNPLKADTDGDGIPDGLEVKQGTDPLNLAPGAPLLDLQKAINNLK